MKKDILVINPHAPKEMWAESYISLKPFTDFLQEKIASAQGIKVKYFQYVLDRILEAPELQGNIPVEEMYRYDDLLELISSIVFPIMEDENNFYWAFGNALTPEVFYGSNAFYNLLTAESEWYVGDTYISKAESAAFLKELQYDLVLQKLYNYTAEQKKELIHGLVNPRTGLYQYYRINIDRRFTAIKTRSALPHIDKQQIDACLACANSKKQLEEMVPLKNLVASGFTIITFTDVTAKQAVEQISKEVAAFSVEQSETSFKQVTLLLQTIAGNQHYRFGLMPIFTINNRAALLYENFPFSIIVKACVDKGVPKKSFDLFIKAFLKYPVLIKYTPGVKNNILPESIQSALSRSGFPFYSLAPVFAGTQLVGIFEITSDGNSGLTDNSLGDNLLPVIPYISQMLQYFIDKFNRTIDTIIKDQFTNIQPAVQWKFNEAAWHYFRNHQVEKKNTEIENISFNEVYPLYGAVDIQNSTIERNKALRQDLLFQLNLLRDVLHTIESVAVDSSKDLIVACDFWLYQLADYISIEQEMQLNDYLQNEVTPYLQSFRDSKNSSLAKKIYDYREEIDEDEGAAFSERRRLESSIKLINGAVSHYLDLLNVQLQSAYPCYFEKIRTDGAEYDIYMGQSIAPKIPFKMSFLYKTRLIQLQAMAAITRLTNSLVPQLEHALQTTQLVFVHSRPIDICFRNDERRFDVEGAYNIRYHIIKKRIDKVHLRGTEERLTQVGKIAIVYYNEKDVSEYVAYISKLQEKDILLDDLEHLELEELQGVSGLKALRVGVNLE
ncbi:MAG: GAF domain-containing protein [Ferruginibacter sp.]